MNAGHLYSLAGLAAQRIQDTRLPVYIRQHWAHMATGWLRRAAIAERIAADVPRAIDPRAYYQSWMTS